MSGLAFLDLPLHIVFDPLVSLIAITIGLVGACLTLRRGGSWTRRLGLFAAMVAPAVLGVAWPHLAGMGLPSTARTTPDLFGRTELFYPDVQELALPALLSLIIAGIIAWKRPTDRGYAPWAGLLAYGIVALATFQSADSAGVYG